jgi:hypothetical protein
VRIACSIRVGLRDCERLAHLVGAVASFDFFGNQGLTPWTAADLWRGLTSLIDGIVMLLRMPRQMSAECCYAIWKASPVVCRRQMGNDMERELEGVGDSATMGICRPRNNMKGDNVMGSSPLDRLDGSSPLSSAAKQCG